MRGGYNFRLVFEKTVMSLEYHPFAPVPPTEEGRRAQLRYAAPTPPDRIPVAIRVLALEGNRGQLLSLHILVTSSESESQQVHFRHTLNFKKFEVGG